MNPYRYSIVDALKSSWADKIAEATSPSEGAMSYVSDVPEGAMSYFSGVPAQVQEVVPEALQTTNPTIAQQSVPFPDTTTIPRISTPVVKPSEGGTIEPVGAAGAQSKLLSEKLQLVADATVDGIKAMTILSNGFLANSSERMKASNYEFQARQSERSAELLLQNQREITRAAQMDANKYRIENAKIKSGQKTAMAASGFAVGRGVYRNTLSTTDARTNYNIAATVLKGELQNAELIRQAGEYRAQAEIARGNAEIAKRMGKAEKLNSFISAASYIPSIAANLYVGLKGSNGISAATGPGGQKAWAVNGVAMYGRG